jgi:hypothetical protein
MSMAFEIDLREHRTVSNSGTSDNDSMKADLGIRINFLEGEKQFDFSLLGGLVEDPDLNSSGKSSRSANEMFALAEECRKKWKSALVDHQAHAEVDGKTRYVFPFQDRWDFRDDSGVLVDIVPRLARAGEDLFTSIFEQKCDDDLKEVGHTIRHLLASADRYVAITSDKLFQPWGMLYTHPVQDEKLAGDGSNWVKNGFWGYRHIVHQTPRKYKRENRIQPDADGGVPASVNFDDRLSIALNLPIIDQHIEFLCGLGAKIKRTKKSELELVFKQNRCNLERILYFYCHGHGSGSAVNISPPYLEMTDDTVSAFDFERWAGGEKLPTSPLVFINACQGGQMTTLFYKSFAVELLEEGAVGLIGAQIDVPAVFAAQYAKEVFEKFFDRKSTQKGRLGPLLREVNKKLWDGNNNPLGLVYSLYRGIDCFIDWPQAPVANAAVSSIPKKASSS